MKQLNFNTWGEFRSFVDEDRQVLPVYWRGQMDPNWPFASPFEREILALKGGWKENASKIYPYGGRYMGK